MTKALEAFFEEDREANRHNQFCRNDFHFISVIRQGKFGKVWQAKDKNAGFDVSIKKLDRAVIEETEMEIQVFHELMIHTQLDHPNIVVFLTYFHDANYIYLVHQFAEKGSLSTLLQNERSRRFNDFTAAKFSKQIAEALIYLHGKRYFHADLKPENILVDAESNARLGDFGLSWPYGTCPDRGYCGSVEYLPPEILNQNYYDYTIDFWGVGVVIYELLTGRSPFHHKKQDIMKRKICNLDYKFPGYVESDARDLIKKLLVIEPKERLELDDVKNHPWITRCYPTELAQNH